MKKMIVISGLLFASIGAIVVLYFSSDKINSNKNGFTRNFSKNPIIHLDTLPLGYNSFYISGITNDRIYLGNFTAPALLIEIGHELSDTTHLHLSINTPLPLQSPWLRIDYPYFYIGDGISPQSLFGKLPDPNARPLVKGSLFFVDYQPISKSSFVTRSYSPKFGKYVLIKKRIDTAQYEIFTTLLQKQIDGMFDVDGMLHFDKITSRILYVYYYRNQYIGIDTSFNLEFRGRTIDTISYANVKAASLEDGITKTLAAPPRVINKHSCVFGDLLFIHSGLLADNEEIKTFNQSNVIDVYFLKDRNYQFSFYIPNFKKEKLRDLKVYENTLVALYEFHLLTFRLDLDINENME